MWKQMPAKMKGKGKNKFNAQKCYFGGEEFDSKKEMERYIELLGMEQRGEISNLSRQAEYEVIPRQTKSDGSIERATFYIADYVYQKDGKIVVEDVKGYKHSQAYNVFVMKRKLMLLRYGIEVQEV